MNAPRSKARKAGFATFGVLVATAFGISAHANASDIPGPPDEPCTLGERMNIHIVDGWMYECACSVLARGFHCQWDLVGKVDSRKIRRRPSHRRLIPVLVIHVLPAVTA